MSNGIRSLPRYQHGGPVDPTRREFLKRMLGGLGGLVASRFGFPGGDEPEGDGPEWIDDHDYDDWDYPDPFDRYDPIQEDDWYLRYKYVENQLHQAGIDPKDVPEDIFREFMDLETRLPDIDFISESEDAARTWLRPPELEDIVQRDPGVHTWKGWTPKTEDPKVLDEMLDNRYDYNKKLDELLASGDARFRGDEYVFRGEYPSLTDPRYPAGDWRQTGGYPDADPEDVALYKRLQRLSRTREAREAGERQARRVDQMFGPSYSSPGILDSPVPHGWPSLSTAGKWGMRGLGALGLGLGTAVDLAASPTKLGSGDLPEEDRFTDEEMEIIRAKQREEFQLLENLGLTPRLPIGPRVSPQGASIRSRGFGRVSGGIVGLRGAA